MEILSEDSEIYLLRKVSAELSEQEADRQELIELRDLVYKLQNSSGAESEIENADKIQLPYTTKQRVVILAVMQHGSRQKSRCYPTLSLLTHIQSRMQTS